MPIIGGDMTKQITSKVNWFEAIVQQNVIENKFTRKYAPLVTIQSGLVIEF